jgi:hypothetical protein
MPRRGDGSRAKPVRPDDRAKRQSPTQTKPKPKPPEQPRPKRPMQDERLDPRILARQRALRAAGYDIPLDGMWGQRSQQAWEKMNAGAEASSALSAKAHIEERRLVERARELAQKTKVETRAGVARVRQHRLTTEGKLEGHRAGLARAPSAADQHHHHDTLASAPAPIDRRQAAEAEIEAQRIHAAQEQQRLGEIVSTNPAAITRFTMREVSVVLSNPDSGGFDAGNPQSVALLQGWLKSRGHVVPMDGKFGLVTARAVERAIAEERAEQRHQQIIATVDRYYDDPEMIPGRTGPSDFPLERVPRPGQLLAILQRGDFTSAVMFRYLERNHWLSDFTQGSLQYRRWRGQFLEKRRSALYGPFSNLKVFGPRNRAFFETGDGQASLLHSVTSFSALEHQLIDLETQADRRVEQARMEKAKKASWWERALDVISLGEEVTIYLDAFDIAIAEEHDWRGALALEGVMVAYLSGNFEAAERLANGSAAEALERGRISRARFAADHPWRQLAGEMILDPTNLIPGKVIASPFVATAKIALAAEVMGIKLSAKGVPILGEALAFPGASGRAIHALKDTPWAKRHLRPRADAMRAAQARARGAIIVNFKKVPVAGMRAARVGAAHKALDVLDYKPTQLTRMELDGSEVQYGDELHAVIPDVISHLARSRVSLYARADSDELSTIGGMIRAALMERKRAAIVTGIARDLADKQLIGELELAGYEKGTEQFAKVYSQHITAAVEEQLTFFAPHLGGHTDPVHASTVQRLIFQYGDEVNNVIIPDIQRRLLQLYEREAFEVFDPETLIWLGKGGATERLLTSGARRAFELADTVVANPMWKVVVSLEDARTFANNEINRRAARERERAAIRRAEGVPIADEEIEANLLKIQKEVTDGWQEVKGGWMDTRPDVTVPAIYATERAAAATGFASIDNLPIPYNADVAAAEQARPLLGLLLQPGEQVSNPGILKLHEQLDTLIRWTGHQDGAAYKWGDDARTKFPTRDDDGLLDQYQRFQVGRARRRAAITKAFDEAIVQALREEGMWWEALRYTETLPLRVLYHTAQAGTGIWKFSVLALRPAWVVRNVVDNSIKSFLEGTRHPKYWMRGAASPGKHLGPAVESVFQLGLRDVRAMVEALDLTFGTHVINQFNRAEDFFWNAETKVVKAVFDSHGVPVPERALESTRNLTASGDAPSVLKAFSEYEKHVDGKVRKMRDALYELMGQRPEMYFKRALYRATYTRVLAQTGDEMVAFHAALAKVEHTLFDYSKVSVLEDNIRVFWPFVQFWRKNATYWAKASLDHPWFILSLARAEAGYQEINADLPEWMRRYLPLDFVGDAIAVVPGLGWLGEHIRGMDVMTDPLSYLSLTPMWRAFKADNPTLPADRAGWKFLSGFVDAINSWGLAWNPLLRKPLEVAGVLNYRAWQSVFPQTDLVEALSAQVWRDRFGNGVDLEAMLLDPLFERIGVTPQAELNAEAFNEYVQVEMAGQRLRGERVSRPRAEERIRDYLLVHGLMGYFIGAYVRKMTPADKHLYQIVDDLHFKTDAYDKLTETEKRAYDLFRKRKLDPVDYDRYVNATPLIQAYYAQPTYSDKEQFKAKHPEIIQYVEDAYRQPSASFIQGQMVSSATPYAFEFYALSDKLQIDWRTQKAAEPVWVSKELRHVWDSNNTPGQQRRTDLSAAYHHHLKHLSDTFFALPETDHAARQSFVKEHPELERWWANNNSVADDLNSILGQAKADLRDRYFEIVKEQGWATATAWFKAFNFIFEGTSAEGRITPEGVWIGAGAGGHGRSQHARDYLAARSALQYYFQLGPAARSAWLHSNDPRAKTVRDYFAKYSHRSGMTAHAKDYLAVKAQLDHYFSLSKKERRAWLDAGTPAARAVKAYFARYGKWHSTGRAFNGGEWSKIAASSNPEIGRRLDFWKRLFALEPHDRPAFVIAHAEEYGVFVYGPLGAQERHDREQKWMREAIARGMTKKAAAYLRIKPLLDVYFKLTARDEKRLFLKANPEMQDYFDTYAAGPATGNKKLDRDVEAYFKLRPGGNQRSDFLRNHPQVQVYFDKKATPAERSMHKLLDVYFSLDFDARKGFALKHPEITAYFDRRDLEHRREQELGFSFELADPRLAPAREAALEQVHAAELRRWQLAMEGARRHYAAEISLPR